MSHSSNDNEPRAISPEAYSEVCGMIWSYNEVRMSPNDVADEIIEILWHEWNQNNPPRVAAGT